MPLCVGDIVRKASFKVLQRSLGDSARVELSDVSVRVYTANGDLVMRMWANKFQPYVIIVSFTHNRVDPYGAGMIEIPFADPKLFHKIVKIAKKLLAA